MADDDPFAKFEAGATDDPFAKFETGVETPKTSTPIDPTATGFPSFAAHQSHIAKEAWDTIKSGYQDVSEGAADKDFFRRSKGAGKVALGAAGYLASPLTSAYRTVIGQPVQELTGIPREYTEFAAMLATPGIGFMRTPAALRMKEPPSVPPPVPSGAPTKPRDIAAAVEENIGAGRPSPGQTVNEEVRIAEQQAARRVAEQEAEAAREATARRGMVEDQRRALNETVQGEHPWRIESPTELGEIGGEAIRTAADRQRQVYNQLYGSAFGKEGGYHPGAIEGLGTRVKGRLEALDNPVLIDDVITPAASRAIRDLDDISNFRIQNRADPFANRQGYRSPPSGEDDFVAVQLKGVEQARKRLNAIRRQARTPEDLRAMDGIINQFDNHLEQSIQNGLFRGDPTTLEALQNARGEFRRYQQQFTPQRDDGGVGNAMRAIVRRNATPEEIGNYLLGSRNLNAGLPVRLWDHLQGVFGEGSPPMNAIREALWHRSANVLNRAGEVDVLRSADSITALTNSSLGRRAFTPETLTGMREYANGVRNLERVIAELPETQAAQAARTGYQRLFQEQDIGGQAGTAFNRIVAGNATPEETANAMFNIIGGNPGHAARAIDAIERITGSGSEAMGAVRQGVWDRLASSTPAEMQSFLTGRGKTVAERLYDPETRALMQKYVDASSRHPVEKESVMAAIGYMLLRYGTKQGAHYMGLGPMYRLIRTGSDIYKNVKGRAAGGATKMTKADASYEDKSHDPRARCMKCSMFRSPSTCTAVEGSVKPGGWCRLYERKAIKRQEGGGVEPEDVDLSSLEGVVGAVRGKSLPFERMRESTNYSDFRDRPPSNAPAVKPPATPEYVRLFNLPIDKMAAEAGGFDLVRSRGYKELAKRLKEKEKEMEKRK